MYLLYVYLMKHNETEPFKKKLSLMIKSESSTQERTQKIMVKG